MADPKTVTEAANNVRDILVDRIKRNAGLSVKAGVIATVTTFGILTTFLAVNAAIGVAQGIGEGIKEVAKKP